MTAEELKAALDAHLKWLHGEPGGERARLSGANLSGADLSGARLSDVDLSGARLSGARLSGARLSGAKLSGADLSGADLSGAILPGADLSGARLSGADLSGADLSGARLSGVDLAGATFAPGVVAKRQPIITDSFAPHRVILLDQHMQIGRELHSYADWASFDDRRILQMEGRKTLEFWREHKTTLLAMAAADGRGAETTVQKEG